MPEQEHVMAGLFGWMKSKAAAILDPDADARTSEAARAIELEIKAQREAFDFTASLERQALYPEDRRAVAEKVYRSFLARAWRDHDISANEQQALAWVAKKINLPAERQQTLFYAAGVVAFSDAFSSALQSESKLDQAEIQRLQMIARQLHTTPGDILLRDMERSASHLFDQLLRSVFRAGRVDTSAWHNVTLTLGDLGVNISDFRRSIGPLARTFVEAALSNAQADGAINADEAAEINWMLQNWVDDAKWAGYVRSRINEILERQRIQAGELPSIQVNYAGLRAGEIVHLAVSSEYVRTRQLKHEIRQDRFEGTTIVTDCRLIFIGQTTTHDIAHHRVAAAEPSGHYLAIRCSGKGAGHYSMGADTTLASLIYDVAVRKANQTIVRKVERGPDRHIARDVRQRVWQQYGGKCAECCATDYLEFDHIVPVAKGGSNGEKNIQLLCRRCNGKKSDRI